MRRLISGAATALEPAREHDLSSPELVKNWGGHYRRDGEDALWPKPKDRPSPPTHPGSASWNGCGPRTWSCPRRWRCWKNYGP
ncbi:hypothetical protein AB0M48_21995 [Lentzea sp. NPDC051208]|uniref:hypothetical protein n=1 Tax=Lentzea sp. NPDC051208 TaxID=3154642 RepID=UPI00342BF092